MGNRVLLVDDSAVTRTLYTYMLHAEGFETLEADSGFAALETLYRTPCDLAIIDVNMRHMDGFTLTAQMRANSLTRDIPIVIVSTLQEVGAQQRAFQAGANAYLAKPPDPQKLVATINGLLGRSH